MQAIRNNEEKSGYIKTLAKCAILSMERKEASGVITNTHKVATVLHPSFKKLANLANNTVERNEVYRIIILRPSFLKP